MTSDTGEEAKLTAEFDGDDAEVTDALDLLFKGRVQELIPPEEMGEFHDFVVDVGLETKNYTFDVMCNQFVKANATNTAAVRAAHKESRRDTLRAANNILLKLSRRKPPVQ